MRQVYLQVEGCEMSMLDRKKGKRTDCLKNNVLQLDDVGLGIVEDGRALYIGGIKKFSERLGQFIDTIRLEKGL